MLLPPSQETHESTHQKQTQRRSRPKNLMQETFALAAVKESKDRRLTEGFKIKKDKQYSILPTRDINVNAKLKIVIHCDDPNEMRHFVRCVEARSPEPQFSFHGCQACPGKPSEVEIICNGFDMELTTIGIVTLTRYSSIIQALFSLVLGRLRLQGLNDIDTPTNQLPSSTTLPPQCS